MRTGVASGKNRARRPTMSGSSARAIAWLGTLDLGSVKLEAAESPLFPVWKSCRKTRSALSVISGARGAPKTQRACTYEQVTDKRAVKSLDLGRIPLFHEDARKRASQNGTGVSVVVNRELGCDLRCEPELTLGWDTSTSLRAGSRGRPSPHNPIEPIAG